MAQGEGKTLEEAFQNAWEEVKTDAAQKRKVHTATKIQVWGNNPINGFRVVLSPTRDDAPN